MSDDLNLWKRNDHVPATREVLRLTLQDAFLEVPRQDKEVIWALRARLSLRDDWDLRAGRDRPKFFLVDLGDRCYFSCRQAAELEQHVAFGQRTIAKHLLAVGSKGLQQPYEV